MYKFFVRNNQVDDNQICIVEDDVNHIKNVLRLQKNEKIQICNSDTSKSYIAEIIELEQEKVMVQVIEECLETTESRVQLDIFQGLPKQEKMEQIIQKATEIGVNSVTPLKMERCVVKLDAKTVDKKVERWQRIAEVAAKQSKRDKIPMVYLPVSLQNIYEKIEEYDIVIVAYEEERETTIKQVLKAMNHEITRTIAMVIGPEGGMTSEEVEFFRKLPNAKVVTLGKRILRTETAPLVLASVIMYEFDEMQ